MADGWKLIALSTYLITYLFCFIRKAENTVTNVSKRFKLYLSATLEANRADDRGQQNLRIVNVDLICRDANIEVVPK